MSLAAIAHAATVLAAAEEQNRALQASRPRSHSLLSDSTDGDTDPFESDSSAARAADPDKVADTPSKKRRADPVGKPQLKKPAVAMPTSPTNPDSFPAEMLLDLAGSTSAEVRRMNEDERALVHYKRRLRNRESAKRSRARRQATISDIQGELEDLREVTASLVDRCVTFARVNDRQSQELETLRKEKQLLESMLRSGGGSVL